jgi:hypothetical protein
MGLFSPWFLAGAAAVGLPVYLHLLRRHSTTPKPFGSLMFFEPRTQSSIRHRRLRYLLLLSLRMAVLVLLALAFANPFINRPAASMPAGTLVMLVLDTSFSMRSGTRLADAKREALTVLNARRSSERVQVMALDSSLHTLTQPTEDRGSQRAAIETAEASDSRGSFAELGRAVRLAADAVHGPIELHVFSDMQRTNMGPSFAEMALPDSVSLVLHPVANAAVPNWTVESVTAPGQLWGKSKDGKAARVQAVVAGFGTPAATRAVSLIVNGKTAATSNAQIPAGGRATVEFPALDVPYGFSRCEVKLDGGDAFPSDDAYLFTVERSDPERVLFVHASSDSRSPLYFSNALTAAAESAFTLQSITVDQLGDLPLSKYAFVVLSNLPALTSSVEAQLTKYVRDGGSVLIALGTAGAGRSRVPVFGDSIQTVHDYARELAKGRERFLTVGEADSTHLSVGKTGNLSGARFYYVAAVDPSNSRVVARLTDRTPLLLEKKIGEGRALLFASGLDNVTNDFPLHPAFVAFVEQTALYLSGTDKRIGARAVDSFYDLRTTQTVEAGGGPGVEVVDPDGHRPLSLTEAATAQSIRLSRSGFYQFRLANGRQDVVGVNPDRRESNLELMPDDVIALWKGAPGRPVSRSTSGESEPNRKEPYSLWWYIMLLLLVAAVSESWLASRYLETRREEA